MVTRPQQGVFSGTWKGFGVLGRTHKTTLRGRKREHSKVVFSILTPVAPAADYSLRDGYITQSESPDNAGLFRIYKTCYIFKRTEWEGKRTEPKRNFTEHPRKNLENIMRHPYLCIVNERQASVFTPRRWLEYVVAVFSHVYIISGQFCGKDAALK